MATTVKTLAGLSLLIHAVLFTSLNLYLYFRSLSLSVEYQQESEVLDLLIDNCQTSDKEWILGEHGNKGNVDPSTLGEKDDFGPSGLLGDQGDPDTSEVKRDIGKNRLGVHINDCDFEKDFVPGNRARKITLIYYAIKDLTIAAVTGPL